MKWWETIKNKNIELKQFKNDNRKMPPNIYEKNSTYAEHARKFHKIHFWLKYKYLVPLIRLTDKLFGKILIKKVPNEHYNRNIIIFDKAYEEAIKKWCIYYRRNSGAPEKRKSKEWWLRHAKNDKGSCGALRTLKEIINTFTLYDTAYREFFNILMYEIGQGMANYYSRRPEMFKTNPGHLFFSTDIFEPSYFILEKAITYNTQLSVEEVQKLLDDYYLYHPKRVRRNKNGETKI